MAARRGRPRRCAGLRDSHQCHRDALSRYHGRPGTTARSRRRSSWHFYRKSSRAPACHGNGPPGRSRPSAQKTPSCAADAAARPRSRTVQNGGYGAPSLWTAVTPSNRAGWHWAARHGGRWARCQADSACRRHSDEWTRSETSLANRDEGVRPCSPPPDDCSRAQLARA